MGSKPRTTIPRPSHPNPLTTTITTAGGGSTPSTSVRRKRWVYAPATLTLLLLLHAFCHVFAFILLTEPCLNPNYTSRLMDKLNYFALLTTEGAVPRGEWSERFTSAGVRGLFGVGVIQVWFTARFDAYVQKAEQQHSKIVKALRVQRDGGRVGVDGRFDTEGEMEVGNFVRQLEGVSVTVLGLPLVVVCVYGLVVVAGAPAWGKEWKQTAVLACHLTLLIALPLVHVLGLPHPSLTPTTPPPPPTTLSSNPSTHWTSLLSLKPNPTFLLPLYHPLIACLLTTIASTSALALDWNVSYQTYPFPLLVGSLLGIVLGDLYTIAVILFG